ncbi:Proline extensin receptor kinase 1 [Theobroma cacao]|uniref:non-specific serine/threonine protein kinase n=1 Tax=Theobroma cacao TaxID=3641 RepID=A0A061GIK2_THECC|nr:Proline extensin receptor kinase 1 [Theobroma cacao]
MLLAPSSSPSPEGLPFTTSPPPQQSPPVVQPPLAAPLVSPPFPPTNSASPVVSPPLLTPPLAPISTPKTPPPFLPVASPPPAVIAVAPPQPPTPPVVTPPPPSAAANTISPVASPPHPPPPALVISSPPPPQTPVQTPQPPISLPLTSPLPSPTPPTPPSIILPPPATTAPSLPPPRPPTDPPPFSLESPPPPAGSHSVGVPDAPGSSQAFPLPAPPPPLPLAVGKGGLPTTQQGSDSPIGLIVSCIGVGILLFVVFALVCICCKSRRRKQKPLEDRRKQQCLVTKDDLCAAPIQHEQEKVAPPPGVHVITVPPTALPQPPLTNAEGSGTNNSGSSNGIFTYDELFVATNGFSESNLLGQGGFGYVHKGVLPSGQEVAVKQLKAGSHQGEREFQAEVETISRVHHKHLVSLVGYCITGAERLLVYEFVPNKTLEFHLHGNGQPVIAWESRLKIAIGSAKGIAYLHEDCSPTIIHRDIKAANILLDPRFEAKVSDFGLAKIFSDASSSITHVSTRVVGTFGYLAPEYALTGKLTDKSDVYSYGVMLLELITGRRPIIKKEFSINESLVDWTRPLLGCALEDDDFDALADPRLQGAYNKSEMACMVTCAAACIRQSAWLRPRMSQQVVRALEGDLSLSYLDVGGRSWNSSMYTSSETPIQKARQYENMKKINTSMGSKNYGISGNSETTSEYGLNPSGSSSESQRTN